VQAYVLASPLTIPSALPAPYSYPFGTLVLNLVMFPAHFQYSYVSIIAIVVSNYGYFSTAYTLQTCQRYYLVAPAFKGLSYLYSPTVTLLTTL
jgi:hypothetical protein